MAHHQGMTLVAIDRRAPRRRDARALSRRSDHSGDRTFAAGADSARCRGCPPARRRGQGRRQRSRDYSAHDPPVSFTARPDSAHASAVERQVHGDDHGGRLGLQPLAGSGGHAMARGCHLRFVGRVHFPARRAQRQGLVGRISAERRRGGQLRGGVFGGSRRDRETRRHDHDDARSGGLARG